MTISYILTEDLYCWICGADLRGKDRMFVGSYYITDQGEKIPLSFVLCKSCGKYIENPGYQDISMSTARRL